MSTLVEEYYTPELEEFHIGFEFEWRYSIPEWDKKQLSGMSGATINGYSIGPGESTPWFYERDYTLFSDYNEDSLSVISSMLNKNEVRVKYLDREDIESLGWYPGRLQGLNEDSFTLNDNQLYWQDNQFIQIYNWNSTIIFEGIIKNKSELRRLMKQLRI